MDIGIPVEVEGTNGEFYPGIVCGLKSFDEYKVKLLDSANSCCVAEITVSPGVMRLPPEITNFAFDPAHGQEVDVLIPCISSDDTNDHDQNTSALNKLSAWWPGKVKKVSGGFVIVELVWTTDSNPTCEVNPSTIEVNNGRVAIPRPTSVEKTDIVEKHQLRPRSHQANFTNSSFHRHVIDIPDELEKYCRDPANFQHFARRCGLPVLVCMAPDSLKPPAVRASENGDTFEKGARLLVISTDISTVKRAAVIDNTFIDMLRQKVYILQQTEELSRKLEASRVSQTSALCVEDLCVPEHLIHYAIGHQSSNLRRAHNVPGIISIKLNRPACVFRISGQTEEAVQQARAILDYAVETIPVPRCYVGPIVGSGQRHIQHIVDCLELNGLKIHDMSEPEMTGYVAFQLTGTRQAIKDARMFLEFHVASLQDLDRLRGVSDPPSIPPSNDVDSTVNVTVDQTESSGDASVPFSRPSAARSSQRARQKSATLSNGSNGKNNGDHFQTDADSGNRMNGVQRAGHHEDAGDHSRANHKPRPRRPQNCQTNNSAPVRQNPHKPTDRKPPAQAKTRPHAECNGHDSTLVNGHHSEPMTNGTNNRGPTR